MGEQVQEAAATGLPRQIRAALDRDPKRTLIEYQGRAYDAAWASRIAEEIGARLDEAGLGRKEPVVLLARNSALVAVAILALTLDERDILMIHPYQSAEALAQAVGRTSMRAVVTETQDLSEPVLQVIRTKGMAAVELTDAGAKRIDGGGRVTGEAPQPSAEPAYLVQTSGTTGPPKNFPLPYRLCDPAIMAASIGVANMTEAAKEKPPGLLFFPFANMAGLMNVVPLFASGGAGVILDRFNVPAWRDYVVKYRPDRISLPPAGFRMVLEANVPPEDLSSLEAAVSGSAAIDAKVQREFEARYGVMALLGYGATEFAGSATMMPLETRKAPGDPKFGSSGRAVPGVTVRTVDPETREPVPPGVEGLVEVLSPRVSPDWIRTSDLGVLDEDGFLYLRGRADGAIVRGGFKVLPETVERALQTHPKVAVAAVVGVPHERLGEVPVAAIEVPPGVEPPTPEELEAHLRRDLLATYIPAEFRIVEALPRTPSMKVAKGQVKALFTGD